MNEVLDRQRLCAEVMTALKAAPWAIIEGYLVAIASLMRPAVVAGEGMKAAAPHRATVESGSGIAILSLSGVIMPKPSWLLSFFGGTDLASFKADLEAAVANPKIAGIMMNVDSPGGMVEQVPETAAMIRAAREVKPVIAIANTDAASAAYWLASQADELVVTPSGRAGSIGVYSAHEDISGWQEQQGIKTTLISAGEHKTEGNPYEPLSEEAAAAMQDTVDSYYDMFVADVAAGRGVSEKTVRTGYGQGRMLTAGDALAAGMVDRIDTLDGTLSRTAQKLGGKQTTAADQIPPTTALKERARFEYIRFTSTS